MRVFRNFPEAMAEIRRDLAEMGVNVRTASVQDKQLADTDQYDTVELMNYVYTVTDARFSDLKPVQPWADAEWKERKSGAQGVPMNPGNAWQLRSEEEGDNITWEDYLEIDGKPRSTHADAVAHRGEVMKLFTDERQRHRIGFSYAYPDRLARMTQVEQVISALRKDPMSRQAYVAMWTPEDSLNLGYRRVPCSLGWHFLHRNGALHMTYFMRSCEFSTHFQNDIYLAMRLQEHIAKGAGMERGHFAHFMSSFHCYKRNLKGAF